MRLRGFIAYVGSLFGHIAILEGDTMINIDGPMSIIRGDSATYRLTITDENDDRVDLTDYEVELEIKAALDGIDPALVSLSIGDGITLLDQGEPATVGQADAELTSAQSLALTTGVLWLDVIATLDGDRQHVVAPIEFVVKGTVNLPDPP